MFKDLKGNTALMSEKLRNLSKQKYNKYKQKYDKHLNGNSKNSIVA